MTLVLSTGELNLNGVCNLQAKVLQLEASLSAKRLEQQTQHQSELERVESKKKLVAEAENEMSRIYRQVIRKIHLINPGLTDEMILRVVTVRKSFCAISCVCFTAFCLGPNRVFYPNCHERN